MKKILTILVLVMFFAPILNQGVEAQRVYTLTWGSIEAVGGIQYQVMQWLIKEVEERSNGQLKINYYPANQLGSTTEQMDGVIVGTVDVMPIGCNLMGRMGEEWIIDSLPFVFRDQHHRKTYNESQLNKGRHDQLLDKFGVRVIGYNWYRTPHVLVSTKLITSPSHLQGLAMRVPEARGQFIGWQEMGARPTTITWGEVYLALRQGVAEGVSVPFEMIPETDFHEVAPYIIMLTTEWSYENIMMNEATYQRLPENLQKILLEVIKEGGDMYSEMSLNKYYDNLNLLPRENATIIFLNNEPFRAKLKDLPGRLINEGLLLEGVWEKIENL